MSAGPLLVRQHGAVMEIGLDRPGRRNALSRSLLDELRHTIDTRTDTTRAIVLTSTGSVFTAGADFADLTGTVADQEYDEELAATSALIRESSAPVIAAIDGACMGAGVDLALSCDLRVVSSRSWFRVPAVELGLLYNPASIRRLHATLPRATLTRLMVLAERFDGREAVAAGLATHYSADAPRDSALAMARSVAKIPVEALTATRQLLKDLDDGTYADEAWQNTRVALLNSTTRREAVAGAQHRHGAVPNTAHK